MMSFKMFLLLAFFCLSGALFANDPKRDEVIWESAYEGQFSLVHKMVLTRKADTLNDALLNQFIMAYVYYRNGQCLELEGAFQGIDRYLESTLIHNREEPLVLE